TPPCGWPVLAGVPFDTAPPAATALSAASAVGVCSVRAVASAPAFDQVRLFGSYSSAFFVHAASVAEYPDATRTPPSDKLAAPKAYRDSESEPVAAHLRVGSV